MVGKDTSLKESRPPTVDDVVSLCREFNKHGVKYVLIGGFAVNHYGFDRLTRDVDFLVDSSIDNIMKVREALTILPDNAAKEMTPDVVEKYGVVRIADEIVVALLKKACDVTYENAGVKHYQYQGVDIPIADLQTLIKTKQSIRPKDKEDLAFLADKLKQEQKIEQQQKPRGRHL